MEKRVTYIAFDGTEFEGEAYCEAYEQERIDELTKELKFYERDFGDFLSESISWLSGGDMLLTIYIDSEQTRENLYYWIKSLGGVGKYFEKNSIDVDETYIVKTNGSKTEFYGIDEVNDLKRYFESEIQFCEDKAFEESAREE